MKRFLSMVIAFALVLGLMPTFAFAAEGDSFNINLYDWKDYANNNQYFSATAAGNGWVVDSTLSGAKQISGTQDGGAARLQISNTTTYEGFKFLTVNQAS